MKLNIHIHESDGGDKNDPHNTAPPEGTLFGRSYSVEGSKDIRIPEKYWPMLEEVAALIEEQGAASSQQTQEEILEGIRQQKEEIAATREKRRVRAEKRREREERIARGEPVDEDEEDAEE